MIDLYEYFINPAYFNVVKTGGKIKGVVKKNANYISYENPDGYMVEGINDLGNCIQKFSIRSSLEGVSDGMELEIRLVGGFSKGFTKKELEELEKEKQKREEEYRKRKEEERKIEEKKSELYMEECKDFYKNLNIGVKYTPVIRLVMSGLTENSMGNGIYKNTVTHLRIEEDLTTGRFHRKAGECLCKCERKGKKKLWDDEAILSHNNKEYYNKVTCKSCLKILKSKGWIKE